jgi:hypothetical protein
MSEFLATTVVGSWVKVALAAVFGSLLVFLTEGNQLTDVDFTDVNVWVSAAIAAALPAVINYVNPADTRYGRGTE